MSSLTNDIDALAAHIKQLKANNPNNEDVSESIEKLKTLKQQRIDLQAGEKQFDRKSLEALLSRRFFYAPAFAIYGGIAGLYDYGPPGAALQNNILAVWRSHFVLEDDMLEIECTNLTPESVLKTSGHVERFADYMVRDTITGDIFRADHLVKQVLGQRLADHDSLILGLKRKTKGEVLSAEAKTDYETVLEQLDNYQGDDLHMLMLRLAITAPETGNAVTAPALFNLMFQTQIGPTGQFKAFLRPETAQGHFLNFKKLLEFNTNQMPFASASIGKSFRNEISPRQGLLRVREFTMAEIEHYVDPNNKQHKRFDEVNDLSIPLYSAASQLSGAGISHMTLGDAVSTGTINNQTLGYFVGRIFLFLVRIGIDPKRLRFRQHMQNEMAHYACDCWDAEIESSYGWIECVGCADRSAYDLTAHSRATGERLVVREMLATPITRDLLVLTVDKKALGMAFKKDAAVVQAAIDEMRVSDDEWQEDALEKIVESFAVSGKHDILRDGSTYTLLPSMLSIQRQSITTHIRQYTPSVIEPSFGIGRILYSLLEHSYSVRAESEQRALLSLPVSVAPVKVLVLPISHNESMLPAIKKCVTALRKLGIANKVDDSSGSIGKRYSRNDELGTPFAVTIDFQTEVDDTITIRERDSTKQIRVPIDQGMLLLKDIVEERETWQSVASRFNAVVCQEA